MNTTLTSTISKGKDLWQRTFPTFRTTYQIIRAALEKFLADNCTVRANAIAYAIVISIIPVFTVLIRFASIDKADIRTNVAAFLAAYGLTETNEVLSILDEILDNATTIAGVGLVFVVYSATNLLIHLEDAFNFIYRARKARPMVYRFSLYIASFAILPTLIYVIASGASFFLNQIRPPNLNDILKVEGRYWIVASNGILRTTTGDAERSGDFSEINLRNIVDAQAPFRDLYIDPDSRRIGGADDIIAEQYPGTPLTVDDFFSLKEVGYGGDTLYVISETGALFYSDDGGRTFRFQKIQFKSGTGSRNPQLSDMHVDADGRLILLVNEGSRSGLIYRTGDGAEYSDWRYAPLDGIYRKIFFINNISPDAKNIFRNGYFITGKGRYIYSADGNNWSNSYLERFKNRVVNIGAMQADAEGNMYFGGSNGTFWINANGTKTYVSLRANFDQSVRGFYIDEDGTGMLYGSGGLFRYTVDGGRTWLRTQTSALESNVFLAHHRLNGRGVLLAGEEASILRINAAKILEDNLDENRHPYVAFDYEMLARFHSVRSILLRLVLGVFLLLTIFLIIALAYALVPFASVDWRAAGIGAGLTSVALVVFIVIFRTWMAGSTTTGYIYGVWAAIPLGLLVILVSAQIILFGLEVAYVLQHPYLYMGTAALAHNEEEAEDSLLWNFLLLISLTYHHLYDRKRPLTDEQALRFFRRDAMKLEYARDRLVGAQMIGYDAVAGEYFPVRPPSDIHVSSLERLIVENALHIPESAILPEGRFHKRVSKLQQAMLKELDRVAGEVTIADLLPLLKHEEEAKAKGGWLRRGKKKKKQDNTEES